MTRPVFALYNRGETIGLFQMESGGMTSVSKQFDVQKLDDIIALIALYRPGPMDLIPDYIKRKKGLAKIKYEHPLLEEVCADTYGVMIYQEQVMAAANRLAGYSLGQSDLLRRAMGKKDKEKMAKERANFIEGCARTNKIPEKKANAIFDLLEKFAGYGFNKSHSAAYGVISYQTAYLKAHYPVEFMAGLLSNEINNTDKISVFVGECKRMGIPILPPDMNRSSLKFTPEAPCSGGLCRRNERERGDAHAATEPSVTASPRSRTSAKARWPRRSRSASGEGTSLRSRIFAAGSIRASPTARSSRAWSKPAPSIFSGAIAPSFSPASKKRSPPRPLRIAIAPRGRFRFSAICRARPSRRKSRLSRNGPSARKCLSKKNCSASTSRAIRSTPTRRFSRAENIRPSRR